MSSGRVWHVGCPGEFIFHWGGKGQEPAYMCNYCAELWDGFDWKRAEYRPQQEKTNDPR